MVQKPTFVVGYQFDFAKASAKPALRLRECSVNQFTIN
jgi:hypothetical protein